MNYAAIWNLPVVYVCENNHYGEYTATEKVTAGKCIADRAAPFGIPGQVVDGSDVVAVYEATAEAVRRGRSGQGPSLIECETYRYRGHHVGDPGLAYRPKEEIEEWMGKDPIERLKKKMVAEGQATEAELGGIDAEVQREVLDAVERAKSAPYPDVKEVSEHVYA
jgi:pyruvate dehydrogenase E1 component alpha subunit